METPNKIICDGICKENSERFCLVAGKSYFFHHAYEDSEGDTYVEVTNEEGRRVNVLQSRFSF